MSGGARALLLLLLHLVVVVASPVVNSSSFLVLLESHERDRMHLQCYSKIVGRSELLWDGLYLEFEDTLGAHFQQTADPYVIDCLYQHQGNYGAGLRLFDSRWPEKDDCRDPNGGCKYVFEGGMVYKHFKKGGQRLVGELPAKRCKKFLFFHVACKEKPHRHQLAARVISWWQYQTHNPEEDR
ncbi:uncharacterized protein [Typha angustifolia]|uniref:uncharacterized protein n=1 Tax=Typha angustifolia TaxID=59011 RepID=UPI003C2B881C